jgi:hypothetical protein
MVIGVSLLAFYVAYNNDPVIHSFVGSPYYILGKMSKSILIFFGLLSMIPGLIKIISFHYERTGTAFVLNILEMLMSESHGGLKERYIKRLSWRVSLFIHIACSNGRKIIVALYAPMHIGLSVYACLFDNEIEDKCYRYVISGIIFTTVSTFLMSVLTNGFTIFYISQKFLQYHFEQINDRLKKKEISLREVMMALREHDHICNYVAKNNVCMSVIVMLIYFCFTPLIDFTVYQAINNESFWWIKALFKLVATILIFFLYVFAYSCATLYKAAHSPYKRLNSLFVKMKNISRGDKIKLAFYIERFGGPAITTWCFNLFALTFEEFYLFMAAVCTNYFLIVDLM